MKKNNRIPDHELQIFHCFTKSVKMIDIDIPFAGLFYVIITKRISTLSIIKN